jgi:hypothetical protein
MPHCDIADDTAEGTVADAKLKICDATPTSWGATTALLGKDPFPRED